MTGRTHVRCGRALAAALALWSLSGCNAGQILEQAKLRTGDAQALAVVDATAGVVRVTLTVSPGDGPTFTPIEVELRNTGDGWSIHVTGIPGGPGRRFDAVAFDASGAPILTGSAKADVVPGSIPLLSIVLHGTPYQAALPTLDYVSASATSVDPYAVVDVQVSARGPTALGYAWTSTCGSFDAPSRASCRWRAPASGGLSCDLTVTVRDATGNSVADRFTVSVHAGRTVTGSRLATYWPDPPAGKVTVPSPDISVPPDVLVPDGSGGWTVHRGGSIGPGGSFQQGQFAPDGSFVVPGVPQGPYVLCHGLPGGAAACTETAADDVDLGYDVLGRADQSAATASTPVNFALSGLYPWDPLVDELQVTSSGANVWERLPDVFRGGDTGGGVDDDWYAPGAGGPPLHLLSAHDVVFVHQLSARALYSGFDLLFYAAATRATPAPPDPAAVTGAQLADGQAGAVAASLQALSLSASLPVQWSPSDFEAVAPALAPAARTAADGRIHELVVGASALALGCPAPAARGFPELVRFALPAGAAPISDTLLYGRFLPSTWLEWRGARFRVPVSYLAPGAATPRIDWAEVSRRDPLPADPAVVPAIGPALAVQLNGEDALVDHAGVTATPKFSWSAPTAGTPSAYLLDIYELTADGDGGTVATLVLHYATGRLQVAVPPGILQTGGVYYAKLTAEASDVAYDRAPMRVANVFARASALTGTFTPEGVARRRRRVSCSEAPTARR